MLNDILNLEGLTALNKKEQSQINGGKKLQTFSCYCGFVGGDYEDHPFTVNAESLQDALWGSGLACQGLGATCSGV